VIGSGVTVKNAVLVWNEVTIEDEVFVGPNAVFTNDLRPWAAMRRGPEGRLPKLVRRGATIGADATIVCGVTIGEHAFVAAGAVVARGVAAHALVAGNPARFLGWVCTCGERLSDPIDHEFILGAHAVQNHEESGTDTVHDGAVPGMVFVPALTTASTQVTFPKQATGELIYACHMPGHNAYGMRGSLEITS